MVAKWHFGSAFDCGVKCLGSCPKGILLAVWAKYIAVTQSLYTEKFLNWFGPLGVQVILP